MSAPAAKAPRKITLRRQLGNEALKKARPRFRQLLNAREMDFSLTSDHTNVRTLVTQVLAALRAAGHLPSKRHERRREQHVTAVLLNLYAAHETNPKRHVAIGLSRNKYSERGRYHRQAAPSWRPTARMFDASLAMFEVSRVPPMRP